MFRHHVCEADAHKQYLTGHYQTDTFDKMARKKAQGMRLNDASVLIDRDIDDVVASVNI